MESYPDFVASLHEAIQSLEKLGAQELRALRQDGDIRHQAYEVMNALGYYYGAAIVRGLAAELDPSSPEFVSAIPRVVSDLQMMYTETEGRFESRDESVIRQAAEEMPGLLPSWLDMDVLLKEAQESYGGTGVYIRDFYANLLIMFSDIHKALRRFLIEDARPERVIFQKEGAGGDFVPAALTELDEEEERTLLKNVIKEANRRIAKLGTYGRRREEIPKGDFTIIYWSNGPATWRWDSLTDAALLARGRGVKEITLDANMAVIPFHASVVKKVLDVLEDLPLYVYSTEAKDRGEYPEPTDANVKRAIRSIVEQQQPGIDQEELSLEVLELFELLKGARSYEPAAYQMVQSLLKGTPIWLPYVRLITEWLERR